VYQSIVVKDNQVVEEFRRNFHWGRQPLLVFSTPEGTGKVLPEQQAARARRPCVQTNLIRLPRAYKTNSICLYASKKKAGVNAGLYTFEAG